MGDVSWLEIPATDMARCQAFYKSVFGWEFATPPGMPEGGYAMFSKTDTKLAGGVVLVKEDELIQPKVNTEGRGQITNRITMTVEEVGAALKNIEAAGGKIIWYGFVS
jgi:Predicted enzyme related to lactoylglutathione lyase